MNKPSDSNLGVREFLALVVFTIGIKYKDTTPDYLYFIGKNAAWMMPIFSFVVISGPFLLLLSLLKKHKMDLVALFFQITGKVGGIVLCFGFFLLFSAGTIINFRNHAEIVNTLFFQKTPVPILMITVLLVSFIIASLGFSVIGRTAWLIFPSFVVLMVILVIASWKEFNWGFLFPIAGPGLVKVAKESILHNSIIGEVIILAVFYTFIRSDKDFRTGSLIGIGFSCLLISSFLLLFLLVFDYPEIMRMNFPYQQLTRYITIGKIVSHMEAIFLGFWTIVTTLHFALYIYVSAYLLSGALRLKDFHRLLLPVAGLIFFISIFPENAFTLLPYRKTVVVLFSWVVIILPVCLWVLDKWKGRLKNEKPTG